jgi:phage host-nuclease inhibitor protein Gam
MKLTKNIKKDIVINLPNSLDGIIRIKKEQGIHDLG